MGSVFPFVLTIVVSFLHLELTSHVDLSGFVLWRSRTACHIPSQLIFQAPRRSTAASVLTHKAHILPSITPQLLASLGPFSLLLFCSVPSSFLSCFPPVSPSHAKPSPSPTSLYLRKTENSSPAFQITLFCFNSSTYWILVFFL